MSLVVLLHGVCDAELVTVIPIPFRNLVFPEAVVVLRIALAVRMHDGAHELIVAESFCEDVAYSWEVVKMGWSDWHFWQAWCAQLVEWRWRKRYVLQ